MRAAPKASASPACSSARMRLLWIPPWTMIPMACSGPSNTSFRPCSTMNLRAAGIRTSNLSFSWRKVAGGCDSRS